MSDDAASTPRVVAHDGSLWAIAKPAGWNAHPVGDDSPDVVTWVRAHLEGADTAAPCHRLDRETSGLLLLAGEATVRRALGEWFATGQVEKGYLALVHGRTHRKGIVRRLLRDARRGRALEAVTRFRCLEWLAGHSLLQVRPEHGRKHQIRRHLAGIGHAIVGDRRYGSRDGRSEDAPARLWLHAASLTLPDGRTFEAPLSEELTAHLNELRKG